MASADVQRSRALTIVCRMRDRLADVSYEHGCCCKDTCYCNQTERWYIDRHDKMAARVAITIMVSEMGNLTAIPAVAGVQTPV